MNIEQDIKIFNETQYRRLLRSKTVIQLPRTILFLVKKGEVKLLFNDKLVSLSENSLFVITRDSIYEVISISKDIELRILRMNATDKNSVVSFSRFDAYQMVLSSEKGAFTVNADDFTLLWNMINVLNDKMKRPKTEFSNSIITYLYSTIFYSFLEIMNQYFNLVKETNKRKEGLALEFLWMLRDHYKERQTVDYYADKLNISTKYLADLLKEVTGQTTKELMAKSLITESKRLLGTTQLPVSQIASELNFPDQYSFAKFFKKHMDLTPTQFRKQFQ